MLVHHLSRMRDRFFSCLRANVLLAIPLVLVACGGGGDGISAPAPEAPQLAVAKAVCGAGDRAETGLQGQIPMAERSAGFKGFNCNLQQVSATQSVHGKRLFQQTAVMRDSAGHTCVFGGGAFNEFEGTVVFDVTDPSKPVETAYLTTAAMANPGEGFKLNQGRGLLVSARYNTVDPRVGQLAFNGTSMTIIPPAPETHGFDVYDVKTDCRHPQLLATRVDIQFDTTNLPSNGTKPWPNPDSIYGHEGNFAPDGLTYYVGDSAHQAVHAIDISDPTNPKLLATYAFKYGVPPHGLTVSTDGSRVYVAQQALPPAAAPLSVATSGEYHNGFYILNTSDVQARKPGASINLVSEAVIRDGSIEQLPIQVKIKGKPYVLALGEGGTAGYTSAAEKAACAAGFTPFAKVKIFDISNEQFPTPVSDLTLEANDPKNCAAITPELNLTRPLGFAYDVHHCTVDNRDEATTLACGYFESGIRVYDIRDPAHVKEIAYFNPAAAPEHATNAIGWCASLPFMDAASGMLYSFCQDTGVLALKFTNGAWPLDGSATPKDRQL